MTKKRRRAKVPPTPVALGGVVLEDLPYPHVYYPNHYGTFFAFAKEKNGPATLCACAQDPIENLLRLKRAEPEHPNSNPLRMAEFDSWFFPGALAKESLGNRAAGLDSLRFGDALCHRCNLVPPTMRYCHEMYGTLFIQHFGWYVNQSYLRLGVRPMTLQVLPDVCPPELQALIREAEDINGAYAAEYMRLQKQIAGPLRPDIAHDEVTYWHNVKLEEAEPMIALRRRASQATRKATKWIEDITRGEFGFKKVGEAWVGETLLAQLVARVLPGVEIKRHHRPAWLEGLELDIFVPSLHLALEYQGQQHFHPIKAWGGEASLADLKKRDRKKAARCERNGIRLIAYLYSEPLTEAHLRTRLNENATEP